MTIKFLSLAMAAGLALAAPATNAAGYNFSQTGSTKVRQFPAASQ